MHIMDWNNGSENQHIALKAAFVLIAVCLQKPSQKSKTKDPKECLTRRVALRKNGDIDQLIREGRTIQQRIGRSRKIEPPNKAKIFAKLVIKGQIIAALRYLSDNDSIQAFYLFLMTSWSNSRKNIQYLKKPDWDLCCLVRKRIFPIAFTNRSMGK